MFAKAKRLGEVHSKPSCLCSCSQKKNPKNSSKGIEEMANYSSCERASIFKNFIYSLIPQTGNKFPDYYITIEQSTGHVQIKFSVQLI